MPELFLPLLGLVDDAFVLAWLAGAVLLETERYLDWERRAAPGGPRSRRPLTRPQADRFVPLSTGRARSVPSGVASGQCRGMPRSRAQVVRARSQRDIVAGVPVPVRVPPAASVVVISLRGPRQRVGLVTRARPPGPG